MSKLTSERIAEMRAHPGWGIVGWPGLNRSGGWSRHSLFEELDGAIEIVDEAVDLGMEHAETRSAADAVRLAISMLLALDDNQFSTLFNAALDDRIAAVEIEPIGGDD